MYLQLVWLQGFRDNGDYPTASTTHCPIEDSLESVLRIKLGNKIKTCCYAMNFKRYLTSPILNSV